MRTMRASLAVVLVTTVAACASPGAGESWRCSAEGLVSAYYTGSDKAMIHLQGFSSGGNYKATKNAEGTEATGMTANGTPFKCVKLP